MESPAFGATRNWPGGSTATTIGPTWSARSTPQIGWYVGYIEKPGATWIFAMNIDMRGIADLPLRQALTRASLKAKGIIE